MKFETKIEIEKNCHKIINRLDSLEKNTNFSSIITDDSVDAIVESVSKIMSLIGTELYGYDVNRGESVKIR